MKLQEKHLEEIHSKIPWSGNAEQADNNYSKAAEASTQITKDYMKRFAEWCSINGWSFYSKDNIWRKYGNGGFEYKTTEELFNQFTNR